MSRKSGIAALAAVLAVAGGASAQVERPKVAPSLDSPSLYGRFLAGRSAMQTGDSRDGAAMLAQASAAAPGDQVLRERAFSASLLAGDVTSAAKLAPAAVDKDNPALHSLGRLTRAVEAMAEGRGREAHAALSGEPLEFPHRLAAAMIGPWAAASAGRWDDALKPVETDERLIRLFAEFSRARLLEARRKPDEAEAAYKGLMADGAGASLFRMPYGEFLERRGRRDEALALYDEGLAVDPNDGLLKGARERAAAGADAPDVPDMKTGAAESLFTGAALMMSQRQVELAAIYLRLSLRLDPNSDPAWLMTGDAMNQLKDEGSARAAWARVRPESRWWIDARTRTAWSLQQGKETEKALALAEETRRARPASAEAVLTLADLYRAGGRHEDAAGVVSAFLGDRPASDWRLLYLRGAAWEQAGRWDLAEKDMLEALKLSPNEPELLNFLGYSWIDRGVRLNEGMAMIRKAVAARPHSGAIQDSLGWAHYRIGEYEKAVEHLELAVELDPNDPALNDHLGDAYWMIGRKAEAGFQWARVLTLKPDAKLTASVEAKLKDGLGPRTLVAGR
ncbi:MAG TPA: tetratricopeptide repeat protein [Caulobacteraceae bacterium]|nr:tetratricopeptide repeat protein [Caulobacteraceae bacterium]